MIAGILFSCNNSANEEQKAEEKQNDLQPKNSTTVKEFIQELLSLKHLLYGTF